MDKCKWFLGTVLALLIISCDLLLLANQWLQYDSLQTILQHDAMIKLDNFMSTFWCEKLQLDSDGKIDAFYFDHMPGKSRGRESQTDINVQLDINEFKTVSYTMTAGSIIEISGGSLDGMRANLWIFDNEKEARNCIADIDECSKSESDPVKIPMLRKDKEPFFTMEISKHLTKFFVIKNLDRYDTFLHLKIKFYHSYYDVEEASEFCLEQYRCIFSFPFFSDSHIAVRNREENGSVVLLTHCTSRLIVYLLLFLVLPVVAIGLLICITVCFCSSDDRQLYELKTSTTKKKSAKRVSFAIDFRECSLENEPKPRRDYLLKEPLMNATPAATYGGVLQNYNRKCKPVQNLPKTHNDVYNSAEYAAIKKKHGVDVYL